jgi:serpin B
MLARILLLAGGLLLVACKTPPAPASSDAAPGSLSLSTSTPIMTTTTSPPSHGDRASLDATTAGDRDFAARLYARVRTQDGNLSFSPTSIRLALAMAYGGARGDTKAQMGHVLGLGERAPAGFAALLTQWSELSAPPPATATTDWGRQDAERKRMVLRVANRLWGQRGKTFREDFLGRLRDDYGAPLEQLDFHDATDASRRTNNTWVADQTEQKIQDLLGPGTVTVDTRLVLTNAVYFKASWATEFYPNATQPADFTTASGKTVKASMMRDVSYYRHAALSAGDVPCSALELPYGAPGIAMIVLLPDAKDGLASLEAKLDGDFLDTVLDRLAAKRVDVGFPRFRSTSALLLGEVLSAMGMPAAFAADKADFSGMDDTRELYLGAVVHKAFVAVDEKGTEAAAATAVAMAGAGVPRDPRVPFHADHPFVFLVVDRTNRTVLFMGRVNDPTG